MEPPAPVGEKSAEDGPRPPLFPHIFGPINAASIVGRHRVLRASDLPCAHGANDPRAFTSIEGL
jgi:hypothetical protein